MPKIKTDLLGLAGFSGLVTPCLTCVPMGATFSVALTQAVTTTVLRKENLPVPTRILSLLDTKLSRRWNVVLPYIDDINVIGTAPMQVDRNRNRAKATLAAANLKKDPNRDFSADEQPYKEAIGLAWWKDGVLTVKPPHAFRLFRATNPIVFSKRASPLEIRQVVVSGHTPFSSVDQHSPSSLTPFNLLRGFPGQETANYRHSRRRAQCASRHIPTAVRRPDQTPLNIRLLLGRVRNGRRRPICPT